MLAFDIETEGLKSSEHRIIVASVYDPDSGMQRTFNFMADPAKFQSERDEFIRTLDEAPALCSFNGVRFDIPFIAARFNISAEQQGQWVLKTLDLFEVCKLCFGSSCSLKNLLAANGLEQKSSHGLQAIEWAKQGNWKDVEEYCMRDAMLTHQVSSRLQGTIMIPLTGWSHPIFFSGGDSISFE
jgi:uncharacterized protein YprB with RNaseH-like and TPR domain